MSTSQQATFAAGCFWGVEGYFAQLKGVMDTTVGYIDGNKKNPTYQEVCSGIATHAEAMEVFYDEQLITLEKMLEHFFRIIGELYPKETFRCIICFPIVHIGLLYQFLVLLFEWSKAHATMKENFQIRPYISEVAPGICLYLFQ